jgi:predicted transcriptional regulator
VYTYTVRRTQVYLTAPELRALDRAADRTGRTRSALIREAIRDRFGASGDRDTLPEAIYATAGAWGVFARTPAGRDGGLDE